MASLKQRKAQQAIDLMFKGLDDPILKQVMLTCYSGADPKILEEMQEQEKRDFEELTKHMEIINVNDVVGETKTILSNDIVTDGNNSSKSIDN